MTWKWILYGECCSHSDYLLTGLLAYLLNYFSFFSRVFSSASDLKELDNIYISCTPGDMNVTLHNWINTIGVSNKLRVFNGGHTCGSSNGKPCENITLCPGNPEIVARVLSANAANCNNSNKNIDSIVIGIRFKNFSMQLNGDFEDFTSSVKEVTQLKCLW